MTTAIKPRPQTGVTRLRPRPPQRGQAPRPRQAPRPPQARRPRRFLVPPEEIEPCRERLIPLLRRLGSVAPGSIIHRYGAANVAAALYYVIYQRQRGYRPQNPGGLVTWLLKAYDERKLQGWQLQRILRFAWGFREVPWWARCRLLLWAKELHATWLGRAAWRRLYRLYGEALLEEMLRRCPYPDIWRTIRYLLATYYKPLPPPTRLHTLLSLAKTFPRKEAAARAAASREQRVFLMP